MKTTLPLQSMARTTMTILLPLPQRQSSPAPLLCNWYCPVGCNHLVCFRVRDDGIGLALCLPHGLISLQLLSCIGCCAEELVYPTA